MAVGGKYSALTAYLTQSGQEKVRLTFEELNRVIPLPNHAYLNRPSWANHTKPMSFSSGWLNAGYSVEAVSLAEQQVAFCKTNEATTIDTSQNVRGGQRSKEIAESIILEVVQHGYSCYDEISSDQNHRYLSWEHCHKAFLEKRYSSNSQGIDILCLNLAWYLASWGMLRNSFLMQKDYKIHTEVVKLILQPEWEELWDIPPEKLAQEKYAKQIINLGNAISDKYTLVTGEVATDTLLTKILLGTLGCTPAYDRYFKKGLKFTEVSTQAFTAKSLMALGRMYIQYQAEFSHLQQYCSERIYYPAAKVIDMCLFEFGLQLEKTTR